MTSHIDRMQELLERQRQIIKEVGWTVMAVMRTDRLPGFAYTVGLSNHSQPELMVIGLPAQSAHYILNKMAEKAMANTLPNPRGLVHEVASMPLSLRQDDDEATMGELCRFAQQWSQEQRGRPCGVMQVIYPDEAGKFPWEPGCDQRMVALQDPTILKMAQMGRDAEDQYRHPRPH
jgi:hypothetical protein